MDRYYINSIKIEEFKEKSYVSNLEVVKSIREKGQLLFNNNVTFIVGENGVGKSTLIEAIAIKAGFNPEGGSKNFAFETKDTTSPLKNYIKISKAAYEKDGFFLRSESFYNVISEIDNLGLDLSGYGGTSLHKKSHGESIISLVQNRFRGNGLYILDEIEVALSTTMQLVLLGEIARLVKENSQFIIATHSPILLAFPNALIYEITKEGINEITYKESANYILTKDFLNNTDKYLDYLLKE